MSWWWLGSAGRSQDTLSPGKDTETWLSVSITQPVLLELHMALPATSALVETAKNRIDQTTPHAAPLSSAGRLSERNISIAQQCGEETEIYEAD
ncbi:hypothetical protein NQZ68_017730 [Dissostichus eleginoides]|nr:hypothetical protein NQZ68_017730 [Dissostichus eleginoides]